MNIIVSAAALRTSGGNTIYRQFIEHLRNHVSSDDFYYIFIDYDMQQPYIKGVEYICVDIRSHIKRCLFDYFICARILKSKDINPDFVISLQNTGVHCLKRKPHLIYYHQSIPFYSHKWSLFKSSERTLFFYKYIYPLFVKLTLTANTQIVVQTHYIKEKFVDFFKIDKERVHVQFPDIENESAEEIEEFNYNLRYANFIYPATGFSYKEHLTLFRALSLLKTQNPKIAKKIRIYLTISKEEYPQYANYILKQGIEENICFIGKIDRIQLFSMYKASNALLFPSTLETIGLPLLEAASMGSHILVSDLKYAKEVLQGYEGSVFISPYNYQQWADEMSKIVLMPQKHPVYEIHRESAWNDFFALIKI